ncbi:MAG: tetratricopeptide repeat protein [Bryobacteraceae bacterium]|jgi:serine/threonine-protein kinase
MGQPLANSIGAAAPELSPAEIRAALERIIASRTFVKSERLCRFLQFTVERTLAGEAGQLKEYAIGRDVFDRDEKYDPRIDSIVRVEARRLRSKLKLYYDGPGAGDPVRILFRRGGYVPEFRRAEQRSIPTSPETPSSAPALDTRSVAVLPFANLSPEPDQDSFCDGVTDEIINTLASIPDLKVIARTSMFHFRQGTGDVREIGRRLGVGTIIEGSVRKSADRVRISASVVDASTGHRLRTASFDREMEGVFAIQDEIAGEIAGSLRITLSEPWRAAHQTQHDLEAYTLFLRGRHALNKMTPAGYRSAIEIFEQAISRFPAYAPPYAALSEAFSRFFLWGLLPPREAIPRARAAALEALRLDDRLAEAHLALGAVLLHHDWQWEEGSRAVRRARELQPSNVQAHIYAATERMVRGAPEEAIGLMKAGIRLDPISLNANRALALGYYYLRQYDSAIEWLTRTLEIDPDFREAHYFMGQILLRRGLYAEAAAEFRRIAEQPALPTTLGALGETYARAGRIGEARDMLAQWNSCAARQYVPPASCAPIYAALGEWDAVLARLEQAYEDHSAWLIFLGVDPLYDPIRSDPRFQSLLSRMQLA